MNVLYRWGINLPGEAAQIWLFSYDLPLLITMATAFRYEGFMKLLLALVFGLALLAGCQATANVVGATKSIDSDRQPDTLIIRVIPADIYQQEQQQRGATK